MNYLKKHLKTLFYVTILLCVCIFKAVAQPIILSNANIYTVNPKQAWAEAIAIDESGIIVAIGTLSEVKHSVGSSPKVIDLKGKFVMPGFQDVHLHALEAGMNELQCVFEPYGSLRVHKDALNECAEYTEEGDWILGSGVNMSALLDLLVAPKTLLDEMFPNRPVLILDDIGHGAWVNSVALKLGNFTEHDSETNGNVIVKNEDGIANGVILENAPNRLRTLALTPNTSNLKTAYLGLLQSLKTLAKNGITSISDAGGYWPQGHHKVWEKIAADGKLTVRASNVFYIYPDKSIDEQLKVLKKLYHNNDGELLRFNQAKVYVDGILTQSTGALLQPYSNDLGMGEIGKDGYLYFSEQRLNEVTVKFSEAGFQLNFHVTGDRAARMALNAIEKSNQTSGPHRLTHLYLVNKTDHKRFEELNVVADFQLTPGSVADDYKELAKDFIGDRVENLLPAKQLVDAGALVTLSSDWDADPLNPFAKIQTVIGRKVNGITNIETAIKMMTINPAIALRHAEKTGSLEIGKFADLIILSDNLFEIPNDKISEVKVETTLLQGRAVYDSLALFE